MAYGNCIECGAPVRVNSERCSDCELEYAQQIAQMTQCVQVEFSAREWREFERSAAAARQNLMRRWATK